MERKHWRRAAGWALAVLLLGAVRASAANAAPVAENLELTTYRGVSVGGRLSAVDPEGGEVTFTVTTEPVKGTVEVSGDGRFVYTPAEGRRGRDYFGYRAVDGEGRQSQEATVIIRIEKSGKCPAYADTAGLACGYAAQVLAETGVFAGSRVGGECLFEPDRAVSRGEFLSWSLETAGADVMSGAFSTGFSDDESIPAWVKPYVATALLRGYACCRADAEAFDAAGAVTLNDAAALLDSLLRVSPARAESAETWGAQAVSNLTACGVIESGGAPLETPLTRADAAVLLLRARELLAAR